MDWLNGALETAQPYWPFIIKVAVIWYLGQVFKKRVWTKGRSLKNGFVKLMRDTMPMHPLAAGALWGAAFPWLPAVEFVTTRGGAVQEGLLAGVTTVVGYVALDHLATARGWTWVTALLHDSVRDRETIAPEE